VGEGRSFLFVINNSNDEVVIPAVGHELVTREDVAQYARVPAGAARVIREEVEG
jgi:beta-galactosidase